MSLNTVLALLGGKLVTNFETLGAVATKTFEVPSNKRWIVFGGYAERDQAATFDVLVTDASDKIIMGSGLASSGTGNISWGAMPAFLDTGQSLGNMIPLNFPIPLDAGMKVVYTWSAGQTTPEVALLVLEYDIN